MDCTIGKYTLIIPHNILRKLYLFIQDKGQNESGGILMGYIANDGYRMKIHSITTPSKFDKATRTSFLRDKDRAQEIADSVFEKTQGMVVYVGEWHTHPEDNPRPSGQDKKMIKEQFQNEICAPIIILMILGLKNLYIGLYNGMQIEGANMPLCDLMIEESHIANFRL